MLQVSIYIIKGEEFLSSPSSFNKLIQVVNIVNNTASYIDINWIL